ALRIMKAKPVDCLVVDESVRDLDPQDVLDLLEAQPLTQLLPVVFFGSKGEQLLARWKRGAGAMALREAHTTDRLLDYVYFFLHRNTASLSQDERQTLDDLH